MEEIDLKDFFDYAKKYLFFIVIAVLLVMIPVYSYDTFIKKPMYKSSTSVILVQAEGQNQITQSDLTINKNLVQTYTEIIKSKLVVNQAIQELRLSDKYEQLVKNISVTSKDGTDIIKITVQYGDNNYAMLIANKIREIFSTEVDKMYKLNNISTLDEAQISNIVSNNTTLRDMAITAFVVAALGIGIIFIAYYFDDTIKYTEHIEEKIQMPVISKITRSDVKTPKGSIKEELILDKYPKSLVSENIKILKTNLQYTSIDKKVKTILITSSVASEGKSFISANLALAFAQAGKKVLLVDCDLRKGRLHHMFKLSNLRGLSNLLIGDIDSYKNYVVETKYKGLSVITRGKIPPNPSELLNSQKNKKLIEKLKNDYNLVIFDGAPITGLSDSILMAPMVDEVLLVCRDSYTPALALESTRQALVKVNANIAGVVFNNVDKAGKSYGYYNYSYKYYEGDSKKS